tara:strand:- start:444 stop:1142 length:699 start_codon:yes stop_codon:yes gene_type:complete
VAKDFANNESKPIQFVYETSGNKQTEGGGFFLDFTNFYELKPNRDNKMVDDMEFDTGTSGFRGESEALLVARDTGDKLPLTAVHVDITKLHKNIMKMNDTDPLKKDFIAIMKRTLTDRDKRRHVRRLQNDRKGIEKWMDSSFQGAVDNKDTKLLKSVGNELLSNIKNYSSKSNISSIVAGEEQIGELIGYLKKTAQTVWDAYEKLMMENPPMQESKKRRVRVLKRKCVSNKI